MPSVVMPPTVPVVESTVRKNSARLITGLLASVLLAGEIQAQPGATAGEQDRREVTEQKLLEVRAAIQEIKIQLQEARADHQVEQQRLQQQDLAIQKASLKQRELKQQADDHEQKLEQLQQRRGSYIEQMDLGMQQLADQVRATYRLGTQSRIKLLLNQDDLAEVDRTLAYYSYFNRAQAGRIDELQQILNDLEEMQNAIQLELSALQEVSIQQQAVVDELTRQREHRSQLLASLSQQIDSDAARLEEAERNQRDLETLLERLSNVLADIPAELDSQPGVRQLKGQLPMPLPGRVRHAYGQRRSGGLHWQGWLIEAAQGSEVSAVAYGRVAFADWLRGYGLLIIIDHGDGYLSLYGNNESLLHDVGAWVTPGEPISVVGDNSTTDQGLYFELRRDGKAVDPAGWIARR